MTSASVGPAEPKAISYSLLNAEVYLLPGSRVLADACFHVLKVDLLAVKGRILRAQISTLTPITT
jgi:hypothetical protein